MTNNKSSLWFDHNPSEPSENFRCGNSQFNDSEWDFQGYVDKPYLSGSRLIMKFYTFDDKPKIVEVVKWYMFHKLTTSEFSTAKRNLDGLYRFYKYIQSRYPYIDSFSQINSELLVSYFNYLLNEAKSETTGKSLSSTAVKKAALPIKEILVMGNVKEWDVPNNTKFVESVYEELIINNQSLKSKAKKSSEKNQDKVSDQKVIDDTIGKAVKDLKEGKNILVASSIVIMLQLGLRISEVITIETGCLKEIGGDMMIDCSTTKLHAERTEVMKPANELVQLAVNKLEDHSLPFRKISKSPYLFLNEKKNEKGHPIALVDHANWNKNFVRPWIKKHNIRDSKGELVEFTSHTFRHAFATYALKGGASMEVISKLMNHKNIRGTQHYTHLLQEEVKSNFSKVFNENAVIAGKKALSIKDYLKKEKPFKGKTESQVDKIRKAMKIQVLSHGLCMHHPMRNEPCAGDGVCMGCNNFVTTPEFLDVHKERLANVQKELAKTSSDGPFENKLRNMENYLLNIIQDLEGQLEYSGNENNSDYTIS
ncbi:site-specific integrase [Alkalibacillus haloalkaliphilus]|uniref:site-specific integrase n=1 Tax=Alkalibacillus haloalkaliphilus TaxID=94136 RepID=UPI0029360554|nr:site-specific integrase [Alkalibacillus haloalkaliphilus]MDV2581590.1 site-specific integrase [Alkalibacillus haloalkaliphilus]